MNIGWKLDSACRERLLRQHPPAYPRAIADHVTYKGPLESEGRPPPPVNTARLIGRADDGAGVEAFVVEIDGATGRPDGGTWHVTWSLAGGRSAQESNDVIAARGWQACPPEPLTLVPATW
jgi:hypothetical protein